MTARHLAGASDPQRHRRAPEPVLSRLTFPQVNSRDEEWFRVEPTVPLGTGRASLEMEIGRGVTRIVQSYSWPISQNRTTDPLASLAIYKLYALGTDSRFNQCESASR